MSIQNILNSVNKVESSVFETDYIISQLNDIVDFINTDYKTKRDFVLDIDVADKVTGIEDAVAPDKLDIGPILRDVSGYEDRLKLSLSFFKSENNIFDDLKEKMGFDLALQFVVFHEIAHYLDKLLKNNWLVTENQDVYQNSLSFDSPLLENVLSYKGYNLQKTFDSKKAGYFLNRKFDENTADCWAVLLTSQYSGVSYHQIIDQVKSIRGGILKGYKNPYNTFSALTVLNEVDCLCEKPLGESLNDVKKSAQQGLLIDLEQLFNNEDISDVLLSNTISFIIEKPQADVSRNEHKKTVVRNMKRHKDEADSVPVKVKKSSKKFSV